MSKSNEKLKTKDIPDLKYILKVSQKGYLWWKKPICETELADIIRINDKVQPARLESLYKGNSKDHILRYIDYKLYGFDIYSRNIIADRYIMSVNSQWSDEEMDKAINHFVTNTIKYK